jgi:hypothetical protein
LQVKVLKLLSRNEVKALARDAAQDAVVAGPKPRGKRIAMEAPERIGNPFAGVQDQFLPPGIRGGGTATRSRQPKRQKK